MSDDERDVGGRPLIVETPEEFDRLVEEYRAQCKAEEVPVTFTGMALHLGFSDRRSLYDYAKRDGFSLSVRKAQALVEAQYEANLSGAHVAGSIFALKNHGWSDKKEHEMSGSVDGDISITRRVVGAEDADS